MHPLSLKLPLTAAALAAGALAQSPDLEFAPDLENPVIRPAFRQSGGIAQMLQAPLVDTEADGTVWVRGRDYRASHDGQAFGYWPVFGSASPREWPLTFRVASATRGGEPLNLALSGAPYGTSERLEVERQQLREVYHLGLERLEQTFEFDALPGSGELVLRVELDTDLGVHVEDEGLRFTHPEFGDVTYGAAMALDADGASIDLPLDWDGDALTFRVPADFLATAQWPVVIDPILETFANGFGIADDSSPDIVFCGDTNEYVVCWEEFTSLSNTDVYVTSWNNLGVTQGPAVAIEQGSDVWDNPRIAYSRGWDRCLVAANVNVGISGVSSSIRGRLYDVGSHSTVMSSFQISTSGVDKTGVDVGGTSRNSQVGAYFCVVWSSAFTSGEADIQYRIVDGDGSFLNSIGEIEDTPDNSVAPTISNGLGDTAPIGDYWTIAWLQDNDEDGYGSIRARRLASNGNLAAGAGNFTAVGSTNCRSISVTSRFNGMLSGGDRPSVLVYECLIGGDHDVWSRVVVDGAAFGATNISEELEDWDGSLDQRNPSVATDGRSFLLAYSEESHLNPGNYDVLFASGNLVDFGSEVALALAERHVYASNLPEPEIDTRICSFFDGEFSSISDDGALIFMRQFSGVVEDGEIRGAIVDAITLDFLPEIAVGVQYCSANANSIAGGVTSSWLNAIGTRQVTADHVVHCIDVPPNQFGYLLCSTTVGNTNLPAGSQGRLCLGGLIGRYTSQVQSSGAAGMLEFDVDPEALPTPGGLISAVPGQTWYFQAWHRDFVGGMSTSNFSNGCAVTFTF